MTSPGSILNFSFFANFEEISYERRKDMQEIIPHLFLGSEVAAGNLAALDYKKISHIVTVHHNMQPLYPEKFTYHVVCIKDEPLESIISELGPCLAFIHNALSEDKNILTHCQKGVSRSASVVIAYLMVVESMSFAKACEAVHAKRHTYPNIGFQAQLMLLEKQLASQNPNVEMRGIEDVFKYISTIEFEAEEIHKLILQNVCLTCDRIFSIVDDMFSMPSKLRMVDPWREPGLFFENLTAYHLEGDEATMQRCKETISKIETLQAVFSISFQGVDMALKVASFIKRWLRKEETRLRQAANIGALVLNKKKQKSEKAEKSEKKSKDKDKKDKKKKEK